MPDITVRQADIGDVEAIYEIETICFPDPWTVESLIFELKENPRALYIVAELDGSVVGYAGLWSIFDEGHITNVAVHPDYRQRHIGEAIMKRMLDCTLREDIVHHTLEVRPSNEAAISMYSKLGFKVEGRRKNYYADNGEDALIMWRHADQNRE